MAGARHSPRVSGAVFNLILGHLGVSGFAPRNVERIKLLEFLECFSMNTHDSSSDMGHFSQIIQSNFCVIWEQIKIERSANTLYAYPGTGLKLTTHANARRGPMPKLASINTSLEFVLIAISPITGLCSIPFVVATMPCSNFAFRGAKSDISHFAARNRTLHISRRETGHSEMTKYQMKDGARHSRRVSGVWRRGLVIVSNTRCLNGNTVCTCNEL
eukprot:COSAG02_NODE_2384_length_8991_cov_40.617521_3_plen_216_part_00